MTDSNPRYVRRGAEVAFSVPAHLEATNWYCFVLPANRDTLEHLVSRYLVEPTHGEEQFGLLAPFVMVYFCHIGRTRLEHAQERLLGSLPYREAGVLVPVFDRKRSEIGAFIPYIWVDSPLAMCAGREIFGYPKGLGEIVVPAAGEPLARLSVRSWAVRELGCVPLASEELLVVEPPSTQSLPDGAESMEQVWKFVESFIPSMKFSDRSQHMVGRALEGLRSGSSPTSVLALLAEASRLDAGTVQTPSLACAASFVSSLLLRGRLPLVFLKQFRDATHPELACHQSIVRSVLRASAVRRVNVLPPGAILTVSDVEVPPLVRELGIDGGGALTPELAFSMQLDFVQDTGDELWSARRQT
jgi:hypothetical protein